MLTWRPITAADLPAIHALNGRAEAADGLPYRKTEGEVRERVFDVDGDPAHDTRLAELDGAVVAYGAISFSTDGGDHRRAILFGDVDPPLRGRGIGRELLAWQVERSREVVGGPGPPAYARIYRRSGVEDVERLLARSGFAPVRWFEDLLRPLEPRLDVPTPDGIEVVGWDRARDDELFALRNAAFADHWGSVPLSRARFDTHLTDRATRLDLSVVAVADGEVVGFSLNEHYPSDEELTGRRDGWIAALGTSRAWRGRGVASALIAASLARFADAGFTHAMLGVDTDNPSGAHGLYRRLGFTPVEQQTCHELRLA